LPPGAHTFGESVEGRQAGVLDREEQRVEPLLGVRLAGRAVDLSEALLQSPRLGEHGITPEQVTQPAAFTLGQSFGCFAQAVSGLVELWAPPNMLAAAPRALRPLRAGVALALTADGIKRGVRAADEMEPVAHDPGVGQRGPDRTAVGVRRGRSRRPRSRRAPLVGVPSTSVR
jgi:hypothetical protein